MAVSLGGTSAAELHHLADKLYKAAARDLTRVLKKAQRDAVRPLQKEIKAEALATLPKRGTYNAIMSKAVKVSVSGGTPGRRMVVRIYARGRTEQRDVKQVNAGILRHPTFGRKVIRVKGVEKSLWRNTRVRPGFVDRPVAKLADQVLEASGHEIGQLLREIARR